MEITVSNTNIKDMYNNRHLFDRIHNDVSANSFNYNKDSYNKDPPEIALWKVSAIYKEYLCVCVCVRVSMSVMCVSNIVCMCNIVCVCVCVM